MKLALTQFSLKHPKLIIIIVLALVVAFAVQFPAVKFDNDPENMLSADEPVRIFHHEVKDKYALYDFVIVGVVNEANPQGVFNVGTLNRLGRLTQQLIHLQKGSDGLPEIVIPARENQPQQRTSYDLTPKSSWLRMLGKVFNHNPMICLTIRGTALLSPVN